MEDNAAQSEMRPAGFWIRAGAYLIDGLALAFPAAIGYVSLPKPASMVYRLIVAAVYFTWMPLACNGQTLGKMAAGIGIVRTDGSPLTAGRLLARWLGYLLSSLLIGVGFLCAAFTPEKRALHDYLVDTRVVYVEETPAWRQTLVITVAVVVPIAALVILTIASALVNH